MFIADSAVEVRSVQGSAERRQNQDGERRTAQRARERRGILPRVSRALGLALACVAACVASSRAPVVAPAHVLAPSSAEAQTREGPFRVVFAGPQGEAALGSSLSIVFSRPVHELSVAPARGEEPKDLPPITLVPALRGHWQWLGSRALLFVPDGGPLPGATRVRVEVAATSRALDGAILGQPYRFEFSTPRPTVVRSTPYDEATDLEQNAHFDLFFNQPIEPAALKRVVTLSATTDRGRARSALAFDVARVEPGNTKLLRLTPKQPLPLASAITVSLGSELHSTEGPLPSGVVKQLTFHTYGPLDVAQLECVRDTPHKACAPEQPLLLTLSNPVKMGDLVRALRITPALKFRLSDDVEPNTELVSTGILAKFEPGRSYEVTLAKGIRDTRGQALARDFRGRLTFDDYWPTLKIGVGGEYFEPARSRSIPVASVNVPRYELVVAPLSAERALNLRNARNDVERFALLKATPGASSKTVQPAARNAVAQELVDTARVLGGANAPGVFAIAARYRDPRVQEPRIELKVVQVSELALSAKVSRHGSLVWVTRLASGEPIAGARVEIVQAGTRTRAYTSDVNGFVRIPGSDFAPDLREQGAGGALIVARSARDWVYRPVLDYVDPWRLPVPVDISGDQSNYGLMFTERGIYRPGDTVRVKGLVRRETPTGNALPKESQLKLALRSAEGDVVARQAVKMSRFGTFSADVRVPASAQLGSWTVSSEGFGQGDIAAYFEVAEYRPAEFKVEASSDRASFMRGQRARWTVQGDYLFGAPMSGAHVRWTTMRAPSSFAPPNTDGYETGAAVYFADLSEQALTSGTVSHGEGKLDERGRLSLEQRLDLPGQRGPELVTFDADVTDLTRATGAGTTSAVAHPADFYVALKNFDDYFVRVPNKVAPEVITVSPDGKRVTGKRVQLELVQRRWTVAFRDVGDGQVQSESKPVDTKVAQCAVTTAAQPVRCELALTQSGYYLIRATSNDTHGGVAQAALAFYGTGANGAWWGDKDDRSLELVPNKKRYVPGETAKVLVKSPFETAEALVTVERAGIYREQRTTLRGPTPTIDIPISDDLRPNAFVGVHLLRPRTVSPAGAIGDPQYRVGYAELAIDAASRRLNVELAPSKSNLAPGEELAVDVGIKDSAGKPRRAEVTLYAVDEGVLMLSGYEVPDPVRIFTRTRPLQVVTLETRAALAKVSPLDLESVLGLDKGRDGGGGGNDSVRRDFRQSVYFNPALLTGDDGRAQVRFKLPDSLTTYRVMAVALTDGDAYGFGSSHVTTSKPLMARPALPRFLRAGDQVNAGVVVSGKDFGPAQVAVNARVSGLELTSAAAQTLKLERNRSAEARFTLRASSAGSARIRFDVATVPGSTPNAARDAVEVTRMVQSPAPVETVALYGATGGAAGEKLGDLSSVRHDVGSLELSLASSALVGLGGSVQQLVEYPYECTEQLASRLLPLLPLRDLARDFGIDLGKNTDAVIDRTVAELLKRQWSDGAFHMWPDSEAASKWVSSYALWTLADAKQRGRDVPPQALERGKAYLRRFLQQSAFTRDELASVAFVLDVLAELGAPDPGYVARSFERRKELPLFSRAVLLHAMVLSKSPKQNIDELLRELEAELRVDGNRAFANENLGDAYAVLLDSPTRTTALLLRALVAASPRHPLAGALARGLLSERRGGTWRNTQESAFALLALDAYRRAQETATPDFEARVWLSGRELFHAHLQGRDVRARTQRTALPALDLRGNGLLTFQKEGTGTLFYEARLRYANRELPANDVDQGFFVQKWIHPVAFEELDAELVKIPERSTTAFRSGDLVLTDLIVVTPAARDFVVIDDPLPAGFEAVDTSLATSSAWLSAAAARAENQTACAGCEIDPDALADGRALASSFHRELRDDRVVFLVDHMNAGMYHYRHLARATSSGSFVLPPVKVEQMYVPEVFGRTAATRVEVR